MKIKIAVVLLLTVIFGTAFYTPKGTQRYVALLSQENTDNPTIIVLENSLNCKCEWVRVVAGYSRVDETGRFPQGRTTLSVGSVFPADDGDIAFADLVHTNGDDALALTVNTHLVTNGEFHASDNGLRFTKVEIIVYPVK